MGDGTGMAQARTAQSVNAERWELVKDVLAGALETRTSSRAAYLDQRCEDDHDLRNEVESLLHASADTSVLDHSVVPMTIAQAMVGEAIGDQYEVIRLLGEGGMGSVYLARERSLDRLVAIKILRPDLATAPELRERFRREARTIASLSHPGIVPLHTVGEVRGMRFFVMGYARGISLAERLRLEGRLPVADALRILIELADAIECAHLHGVLHRDIKPSNILLDDTTGRAVLADFGIAKMSGQPDNITWTGAVLGTPGFMSPEQASGQANVDERSDIFSLGVVGFTMLAGQEPVTDSKPSAAPSSRPSLRPVALSTVAPTLPSEIADVIMRCLERKPESRWASAGDFARALRLASGDPQALPEALRSLPSYAPFAMIWSFAWLAIAMITPGPLSVTVLLLLMATVAPLGLLIHVWNVGDVGLSRQELVRVAFWPPEFWSMWWPKKFRRPTDLWSRLPWQARSLRVTFSAVCVVVPALILLRARLLAAGVSSESLFLANVSLVGGLVVLVAGAFAWALSRGLSAPDAGRLLFGSTAPVTAWNSSRFAGLVARGEESRRQPNRDIPGDFVWAISDLLPLLPHELSAIGSRCVNFSVQLVAAIEQCDAEVADIDYWAAPVEMDRVEQLLAGGGASASLTSSERGEMQVLLQKQLETMRAMRVRRELVTSRRARFLGFLRALHAQLGDAVGTQDTAGRSHVSDGRLIALCDEVERACAEWFNSAQAA
jgi:serine/threonine protein kinase